MIERIVTNEKYPPAHLILCAGGSGSRMGSKIPKQFLKIKQYDMSILELALLQAARVDFLQEIVLVCDLKWEAHIRKIITSVLSKEKSFVGRIHLCQGGIERQESVFNGLKLLKEITDKDSVYSECDDNLSKGNSLVLIHDAARPFASNEIFERVINALRGTGKNTGVIPAISIVDSIRHKIEGVVPRKDYVAVQTPQGFRLKDIMQAHEVAAKSGFRGTDDASVLEYYGGKIKLVEGDAQNKKLTYIHDLEGIIENNKGVQDKSCMKLRVGNGYDVHKLVDGRPLILGGVLIPFEKGLDGHSDADVLVHAIMDSILGAASLGDIGKIFPDTDPAYKNADSIMLLRHIADVIKQEGYRLINCDTTLICQRPKLSPFIDEMKVNIAACFPYETEISVKATTTEGLGFEGRGEGVAAYASCILAKLD